MTVQLTSRREKTAEQQNKTSVCVPIQLTRQSQRVPIIVTTHVEVVCLLSKLKTYKHIDVELEMDELDLTAAESKATYAEIK